MVRISKQEERRAKSHRRPRPPSPKSGPKKDALPKGFKEHANAIEGNLAHLSFIPKIK
ncbi:MAG: hypothetical protein K2P51_00845 [Rhabdochlamydiaceae bacterium]|jgi:hypothetical protein|nr:hypothetical protein [Rhabdochlamydiaceae bacterium]